MAWPLLRRDGEEFPANIPIFVMIGRHQLMHIAPLHIVNGERVDETPQRCCERQCVCGRGRHAKSTFIGGEGAFERIARTFCLDRMTYLIRPFLDQFGENEPSFGFGDRGQFGKILAETAFG